MEMSNKWFERFRAEAESLIDEFVNVRWMPGEHPADKLIKALFMGCLDSDPGIMYLSAEYLRITPAEFCRWPVYINDRADYILSLYEEAADKGSKLAAAWLAYCYDMGVSIVDGSDKVRRDRTQSVEMLRKLSYNTVDGLKEKVNGASLILDAESSENTSVSSEFDTWEFILDSLDMEEFEVIRNGVDRFYKNLDRVLTDPWDYVEEHEFNTSPYDMYIKAIQLYGLAVCMGLMDVPLHQSMIDHDLFREAERKFVFVIDEGKEPEEHKERTTRSLECFEEEIDHWKSIAEKSQNSRKFWKRWCIRKGLLCDTGALESEYHEESENPDITELLSWMGDQASVRAQEIPGMMPPPPKNKYPVDWFDDLWDDENEDVIDMDMDDELDDPGEIDLRDTLTLDFEKIEASIDRALAKLDEEIAALEAEETETE